jgi:predicted nucleic acid-binding protein
MAKAEGLVIDTSIWINLLGTGRTWEVIDALPYQCCAPEQVILEVLRDPISGMTYGPMDHPLRDRFQLDIVTLHDRSLEIFLSLVGGAPADNLGDGEAAAIAIASVRGCAVALDERKARRVARQRFPEMPTIMSWEILRLPTVAEALGTDGVSTAVSDALKYGRMHTPKEFPAHS